MFVSHVHHSLEPSLLPHVSASLFDRPLLSVPPLDLQACSDSGAVSELWAHWQPKPCEQRPWGVGAQQWQWARETFMAREGPPFPYNGKVEWFVSEYGHILLIKPTQKRQHCNIFQWLFIMNYVSLSLNCYYFSLMLLGACIIYSIGSCGTMK